MDSSTRFLICVLGGGVIGYFFASNVILALFLSFSWGVVVRLLTDD